MVKFDPTKFTAPSAKPLPVILLLDVSGSMQGEKIRNLNAAVMDMLGTFRDSQSGEVEIHVAIITFGAQVALHQQLASAASISWHDLSASGVPANRCAGFGRKARRQLERTTQGFFGWGPFLQM